MGIAVLGPVTVDDRTDALTPRDRMVLAALAVRPGVQLSTDQLAEVIWGASPPSTWIKVIQGCVVRLRKVLGTGAIQTTPQGYRLVVPKQEIDAHRFEHAVERARSLLESDEAERALHVLTEALGLWRGEPWGELSDWDAARIETARLEDLRRSADELRVEAALRCGRHDSVLASAQAMVREAPQRERRWMLLAMAQYQSGRQGEALATVQRLRAVLRDELGLDPSPDVEALELAILRQDPAIAPTVSPPTPSDRCPYRGLRPFDVDDAEEFFGREVDLERCLRRLDGWPVLAVVGPSGSGKSSLVRAGVAAALIREGRRVVVVTPGRQPLATLPADGPRRGDTLVVDQGEELFTACDDEESRRSFVGRLVSWARTGQVVLSLRADHLADLSAYPELARLAEGGLHILGAMAEPDLRKAVEAPAQHASLVVEPGLVDVLVAEVSRQPGSLPLMSHALAETWSRREGRLLTLEGYRASGGMQGAVAQSAEQVYASASDDQRAVLRDLLLRLVLPGPVGEPVRSRLPRRLVVTDEDHDAMVDLLVRSRLVTTHDGTVEIAHEALASAWPRLRSWLDDDLEGRRTMHHLANAADAWETLGRPDSELYRGVRLAQALQWREHATQALSPIEQAFLDSSAELAREDLRRAEELARQQTRTNRRLRALLTTALALLLVAIAASGYAVRQARQARDTAAVADAGRVGSRALLTQDIALSLLLGVAGVRIADTSETGANLVTEVGRFPYLVRSSPGAGGYVDVLDVSRDGSLIAAGDDDNRVHVYDTGGRRVSTFSWGEDPPLLARSVVAFSPTDDLLAVGSMRPVAEPVRLLDPDGLRPLRPVLDIPGIAGVRDLAISANGDHLAALLIPEPPADAESSPPPTAMVWDLRGGDGTPVASLELPDVYQGMAISPDGLTVYTSGPAAAYDVTSGERLWRREDVGSFFTSDLSPDGALLALNKQDHAAGYVVPVLDTRTGKTRLVLRGARDTVRDLRFSRSGELLVAGTRDGEILVFDTKRGRVRERWSGDETVWSVDFSPDGKLIFAGGSSGMLRTWDLQSGSTYLERIAVAGAPRDYVFADLSHDGNRAAYRWLDRKGQGWVRFVETHTGAVTPPAPMPLQDGPWVAGSWTSDDSAYAAHAGCVTPCSFGGTVTVFDPATGRARVSETVIPELDDDDNIIFAMTHTPDDSHLLAGDLNGEMSVIDADDLESHGETLGDAVDCCLTPVPRSDRLVYLDGSDDGAYDRWRLFDVDAGRDVTGGDLAFRAFDVAAAPDGRNIVVVGRSGEVTRVDLASGRQVRGSTGHSADLMRVAYSHDGTRIVTGAADGAVSTWNAADLQLLGTVVPPHRSETAVSVRFIGSSHDVVIASHDGSVYRWRTDVARTLDIACRMAGRTLTRDEWDEYLPEQPYRDVCPQP